MIIEVQTDGNIKYGYDRYEDILLKSEDGGTWHYISCNGEPVYSDYERKLLNIGRELDKEIEEMWVQREIELHEDPNYQEYLYQQWLEHEEQQRQLEMEEKNFKLGFEQKKRELIKMGFNDDEIKLIESKFLESMEFCNLEEYVVEEVEKYIQELVAKRGNVTPILPETIQDNTVFPIDALPYVVKDIVIEGQKAFDINHEFFAIPALVACATAIGSSYEVAVNRTLSTKPIIYACLISRAGTGKSPAQDIAMKPLKKLQKEAKNRYDKAIKQFEKDIEDFEKNKKFATKNGEDFEEEMPIQPRLEEYYTTNSTIEGIAKILSNNPKGIANIQDEFLAFYNGLNGYRQGKGSDMQEWLSFWNGNEVKIDRKGQGTLMINDPYVSIVGAMTPSGIREIAKDSNTENGFLDRFLFSFPTNVKPFNVSENEISEEVENTYYELIKSLLEIKPKQENNKIRLSSEAMNQYKQYCKKLDEIAGEDEKLCSIVAKLKMYSLRLGLVIHLCEKQNKSVFIKYEDIQEDSMQKAIQLCEYFRSQADKIYEKLAISENDEMVERAIKVLKKKAKQDGENYIIKKREIQQNIKGMKAEQMNHLATDLIERQILSIKEEGKQGSVTYVVNPAIMQ
ncbi:DUF3987 domain-containing protein [Schinkia azotoformans]|uniref:DUF3987 domain-containing protein n=1 Tax=Schinkia azotoformans TaxID=1454 RepID=UPI002DBBF068|nr:DUF3987 domain-containing protein [Schinkia azotoformans]MEC1697753.1 DUF3987 domain-containing protein [Schinkia azotoformans]